MYALDQFKYVTNNLRLLCNYFLLAFMQTNYYITISPRFHTNLCPYSITTIQTIKYVNIELENEEFTKVI